MNNQLQEVREKLREIQRAAEEVATSLDTFSFEDFEKDYILNNLLFHQRKSLKAAIDPIPVQRKCKIH